MRLVLGGESLVGPLTGIGQYTHHLATNLDAKKEIEDLRFLTHGRLYSPSAMGISPDAEQHSTQQPASGGASLFVKIRTAAAQNRFLVSIYLKVFPLVEKWALRKYCSGDVFHSPNYMLPPCKSRKIATILDLSTVIFPQFHPQARVDFINRHIHNAINKADHIITISDHVKGEIVQHFGVDEGRITTVHLGVDETFRPITKASFDAVCADLNLEFKRYFLFVSTIEPRKNLDRLLDAYQSYRDSKGDQALPLIVAGLPGWKSEDIHSRLQQMESEGVVRYLGFVHQRYMPALVAGARALLYPSLYEGFGLPIVEAMVSATAVMTTRDSAMSEVAGDSAVLVSPYDIEEMADTLCELSADDALVDELQSKGLVRSKSYCWSRCADETLAVYLKAAGN